MKTLDLIWAYRGFILASVKREFQSRYMNTLLGTSWALINSFAMIVVYTVIFSQVMRAKLPEVAGDFAYSIYLCAGVFAWGLFGEITGRAQNIFIENANLLKKLSFPRLCLPVIAIAHALVNFFIVFGLFTLFLLISGHFPGLVYLALIPLLAILIALAIGLGITLGVFNVFFRDVGQFFSVFMQFWFWLTPIVYPLGLLPDRMQELMRFNPMAALMASFQNLLVAGLWPDWSRLVYSGLLGLFFCILGMHLFRKHAADMVDEL